MLGLSPGFGDGIQVKTKLYPNSLRNGAGIQIEGISWSRGVLLRDPSREDLCYYNISLVC